MGYAFCFGAGCGWTRQFRASRLLLGATIFMYLSSALYHALPKNRAKCLFRMLDHGAIFLLATGMYALFTLGILRGAWGWTLFSIVWSLAVPGMTLKRAGI